MSAGSGLTAEEYRDLLTSSLPSASDADTTDPDPGSLFTPDGHRLALEPDSTVVRGARGVGKTVWFKVLQDRLLTQIASDAYLLPRLSRVVPHPGFGAALEPDRFPGPMVLDSLLGGNPDPTHIWMAVLAVALQVEDILVLPQWRDRLGWVQQNPEAFDRALAAADRKAAQEGRTHLFLFDALERLHTDRAKADRLVGGILRLALDLRTRTRHLRAKVFIRHDMFDSGQLRFPDSSKLVANATDLTWTEPNLYGLLFHHLGNGAGEVAARFRGLTGQWTQDSRADVAGGRGPASRWVPPAAIVGDAEAQKDLFVRMAGEYMGTNHRKGHTYTWLPNHLMDGIGQVSPRSFLGALTKAVGVTRESYASHRFALHYEGIRRGVQDASQVRVQEVTEDLPWVETAVGDLGGLQVPTDLDTVVSRWSETSLGDRLVDMLRQIDLDRADSVRTGPKDPHDYRQLVAELTALGVMTRRANGRVDIPDVYRIAFGIGRRGGVPRTRR